MAVNLHTRQSKRGTVYYMVLYTDGQVSYKTLKIDFNLPERQRKSLAEIATADLQREMMTDSRGMIENKSRNFITAFDQHIRTSRIKGINKYMHVLKHLKLCFGNTLTTRQLTSEVMETWREYIIKNFNGETPLTMWRCTLAVINAMRKRGEIKHSPASGIRPPPLPDTLSKQILSVQELEKLTSTKMPHHEVCSMFIWCCMTGMARADLLILKWTDIDMSRMQVNYKRAKTGQRVVVDIEDTTIALLPEYRTVNVFAGLPSDSFCDRIIKQWVKDAGIDKSISLYCARHSFSIMLLEGGADILTVSKLLGHTTLKHTTRYLKFIDALKKKAIQTLPKLTVPKV